MTKEELKMNQLAMESDFEELTTKELCVKSAELLNELGEIADTEGLQKLDDINEWGVKLSALVTVLTNRQKSENEENFNNDSLVGVAHLSPLMAKNALVKLFRDSLTGLAQLQAVAQIAEAMKKQRGPEPGEEWKEEK